jgi:hypothetical protein
VTARLCEALWSSECVTRLLKAVEVEPDNAHPKTRSYGRKHVWSIRPRLLLEGRTRDLAMFNLAIDSKPRGCDIVALKVEKVAPNGHAMDRCFAFDRMAESWRFPGDHTTGACPRKPAGATWLARHSDTLQPNTARNHREKALRAENPSSSATDASGRSRFST